MKNPVNTKQDTSPSAVSITKKLVKTATSSSSNSIAPTSIVRNDNRFHQWKGKWYPRVTHILDTSYPKDAFFYQWVAREGWNAENIKSEAGIKGRNIHKAIGYLLNGYGDGSGYGIFAANYKN